jgi:hypothetical protein
MLNETNIINDCLATIGEDQIDALENHPFKSRIMRLIAKTRTTVLSRGWWFNTVEYDLVPGGPYSTGDLTLSLRTGTRDHNLQKRPTLPWLSVRGGVIYDTRTNTTTITDTATVELVRDSATIAEIPTSVAAAINALVVLRFQSDYDADTNRREELRLEYRQAMADAVAEDVRIRKVNLLNSNPRLARIKRVSRRYN